MTTGPARPDRLRVSVDPAICIGSGTCVRLTRGAFVLTDERIAVLADPAAAEAEQLRRAEQACPTGAIFLDED